MKRSTFEIAKNIRRIIINSAAESMNYLNWSSGFVASEIREIPENLKKADWFIPINLSDLTEKEMLELDFCKVTEEDTMFLIPLWLFPFLTEDVDCRCISDNKHIQKKSEMDNDNRFGCLAYGVVPKKEI
jgi:hypothetical protein